MPDLVGEGGEREGEREGEKERGWGRLREGEERKRGNEKGIAAEERGGEREGRRREREEGERRRRGGERGGSPLPRSHPHTFRHLLSNGSEQRTPHPRSKTPFGD